MKPILVLAGAAATLAIVVALMAPTLSNAQEKTADAKTLKPVSAFDSITDETARSIAIFEETGKVLQHPRCLNCHPKGDSPLQGMAMKVHVPPVSRGESNFGMPGMTCNTCHGPANVDVPAQAETIKSIPGNPNWHVAPIEMAWVGKSLAEICVQIKDENRNGGKTLAELVEHMAKDDLVGWGWNPGAGREPAPGTQAEFGALYEAWAATGAHCPAS